MGPNNANFGKTTPPKGFGIASLALALAPIGVLVLFVLFLLFASITSAHGDVVGASWPMIIVLLLITLMVGLICNVLAVTFGIVAITRHKGVLSWLGIIIVMIKALCLFALFMLL